MNPTVSGVFPAAPLEALARQAASWMKRQRGDLESEVYLVKGQERSLEIKEGQLETVQDRQYEGAGVRVVQHGRMGFAYAADSSMETIQRLFMAVKSQLLYLPEDRFRTLPSPRQKPQNSAGQEEREFKDSLWDPSLFSVPLQEKLGVLREMEAAAVQADPRVKRVLRLGYSEASGEVAVANTLGIRACDRGTHASVGMSSAAEEGSEIQIGSDFDSGRFAKDLNFKRVARLASQRAASLLGGRKLPTRRRAVVLDPSIAGEFLDLIAQALCADQVQHGKSVFKDRLGGRVASPLVRICDDPRRLKGIASSLFDDEGVLTQSKVLVDHGILKDYFYDTYAAARDGRDSNGSAGRSSFKGIPSPGPSNLYMECGKISREDLLRDTQDGVLVLEVMGMHTADPVSGEFSVGVSGLAIENGQITHGVKGAMISGTILEILEKVDAVANDLVFYGSVGSPTFRVSDLTVA